MSNFFGMFELVDHAFLFHHFPELNNSGYQENTADNNIDDLVTIFKLDCHQPTAKNKKTVADKGS